MLLLTRSGCWSTLWDGFETLEQDFKHLCTSRGWNIAWTPDKVNASSRDTYRAAYVNDRTRMLAQSLYQKDLDLFGYWF